MAAVPEGSVSIFDGDIIQLYCPTESGYVYSEPNSTTELKLDIRRAEEIHVPDFAAFCIRSALKKDTAATDNQPATENIFYGSVVSLEHQASEKFLTGKDKRVNLSTSLDDNEQQNDDKSLFRVVSPNQDISWGKEVRNNDPIKLESISDSDFMIHIFYNSQESCYKSSLDVNGTMFSVQSRCHERRKQNPKCIKGNSVVVFAGLDGYLCAKDSFTESKKKSTFGLLELEEGSCKLQQDGRTFFILEKADTTNNPSGPFLFFERCRLKHLFSFKYISVTDENKVTLCDLNEAVGSQLLEIWPVCNKLDHKEIHDSDEIIFVVNVEKAKSDGPVYLSVCNKAREDSSSSYHDTLWYNLKLHNNSASLRSQFTVMQVEQPVLFDCYYAIGISSFLNDCLEKSGYPKRLIKDIEEKMPQLNEKLKSETRIVNMLKPLKALDTSVSKLLKKVPTDVKPSIEASKELFQNLMPKRKISNKRIDLHIQKQVYKKTLQQFGIQGSKALKIFPDIREELDIDAQKILMTGEVNDISRIISYLEQYTGICKEVNADVKVNDDDVQGLLILLHLLVIRYMYVSANEDVDTGTTAEMNVDHNRAAVKRNRRSHAMIDFSLLIKKKLYSQSLYEIILKLIENEDHDISFLSAELIFDIYTAQSNIKSTLANIKQLKSEVAMEMWQLATMTDDKSSFKTMLTRSLKRTEKDKLDDFLLEKMPFWNESLFGNKSEPNYAVQEAAYNSGFFHIFLEHVMQHRVYRKFHCEEKVLSHCFTLLQRITRLNPKVQNELFIYFYDFIKFKKVIAPMICLLNEIFYKNATLCNKLMETDIEYIFLNAIYKGRYQLIIVLQTIIEYSDPAAPVQECIAQLILKHSEDKLKHILSKEERETSNWLQLLHSSDENDVNFQLLFNIINLLASCASKQCHYARSVSLQLVSFDDLILLLTEKVKYNCRKLPFLRLLTCLISESGCASELKEKRQFWLTINDEIKNFVIADEEQLAVNSEESSNIKDLLYITDGVIPFLSQFSNVSATVELTNIGENLKQLYAIRSVSEQLQRFPTQDKHSSVLPKYNEVVGLPKNKSLTFPETMKILRKLIELQEPKFLPCLKRISLEKMILGTLILLKEIVVEQGDQCKFDEKTINTLFDLLNLRNNEIIVAMLNVIIVMDKLETEDRKARVALISCIKNHNYNLILRVHQLLRATHFAINKTKLKNPSRKWFTNTSSTSCISISDEAAESSFTNSLPATAFSDPLSDNGENLLAVLDVIYLLCDRQQKEMQNAMRGTWINEILVTGSNIVIEVSALFFYITKQWDMNKILLAQKTVQALIQMCTGNYKNQEIAFRSQVIVSVNVILAITAQQPGDLKELKFYCLELLEIMLEEIDENSHVLANRIAAQLKTTNLVKEMKQSWNTFKGLTVMVRYCLNNQEKSQHSSLFKAYHVLKKIANYKGVKVNELAKENEAQNKEDKTMWDYCQHESRSVEVVYKPNEGKEILNCVYFQNDSNIHIKDKELIERDIKRTTPQEKLLDLLEWTEAVKEDCEQKDKMRKHKMFHKMFFHTKNIRHYALIFLTVFLNLFVLFTVNIPQGYNTSDNGVCSNNNETCNSTSPMYFQPILNPEIPLWSTILLGFLGFFHAVLAVLVVIEYYARNWGHLVDICKNMRYKCCVGLHYIDCCHSYRHRVLASNKYFDESFQPFYLFIFMLCSVVAWIPYPTTLKYFYCVCLLYPFLRRSVMLYILRALKRSFKQLVTILVLCFVIMYIYAVISFALLNNYFTKERDQFCRNLFECFVTVSHLGLLGSNLDIRPSDKYKPYFALYAWRVVYDLIFYIVVIVLGLNIVIAILVADRFSDVRENKEKVEKDKEKRCFICSIERKEFDKKRKDFNEHTKEEHNMWNYIRFIIYVKNLPEKKQNAIEKYIFDKVTDKEQKSFDFFPLFKARSLPHYEPSESVSEKRLHQLITKTEQLEKALEQVKKKVEQPAET